MHLVLKRPFCEIRGIVVVVVGVGGVGGGIKAVAREKRWNRIKFDALFAECKDVKKTVEMSLNLLRFFDENVELCSKVRFLPDFRVNFQVFVHQFCAQFWSDSQQKMRMSVCRRNTYTNEIRRFLNSIVENSKNRL